MLLSELTSQTQVPVAQLSRRLTGTQYWEDVVEIVADELEANFDNLRVFRINMHPKALPDMDFSVAGYYGDEDTDGDDRIAVQIMYPEDPEDSDYAKITWNNENRKRFLRDIQDTLKHELVHRGQDTKRPSYIGHTPGKDTRSTEHEYLSRPDEMEAFALNVADRLIQTAKSKKGALDLLRTVRTTADMKNKIGHLLSSDLKSYITGFADNPKVLNLFLKKVYQRITEPEDSQ